MEFEKGALAGFFFCITVFLLMMNCMAEDDERWILSVLLIVGTVITTLLIRNMLSH